MTEGTVGGPAAGPVLPGSVSPLPAPCRASDKTGDGAAAEAMPLAQPGVCLAEGFHGLDAPRLPSDRSGSTDPWETCFSGSPIQGAALTLLQSIPAPPGFLELPPRAPSHRAAAAVGRQRLDGASAALTQSEPRASLAPLPLSNGLWNVPELLGASLCPPTNTEAMLVKSFAWTLGHAR